MDKINAKHLTTPEFKAVLTYTNTQKGAYLKGIRTN